VTWGGDALLEPGTQGRRETDGRRACVGTQNLIAKARSSNRRLDRCLATAVTTDARGYNTSDSIRTIRSGKQPAPDPGVKPFSSSSSRSKSFAYT
jgi:hypothetical protein